MQNTIFFYVDAAGFSNKALGVAQRMLDNSDWDWNSTEQVVSVSNMNYLSGNYVKLAVLRQGEQFYFLYNDEVVIQYSSFNVFGARQKAGVGFRSFSTPLSIKGYYASADEAVVAEKARLYTAKLNGENLGNVSGFVMTSGWDLTYDRGENPVAVQTLAGDQYAYFKGINSTEYYAEIQLSVTKDLGDPYPKFGLASRIDGNTFFFFIDGSSGYQSENVGYVWRKSDNSNWDWANSVQSPVVQGISYSDGEYVTLGMLRQGSTFKLYVNGTLQFTVENVENFTDETPSVVSILSFTTGITIKDYFATTDENVFP